MRNPNYFKEWAMAAGIRAVKTVAQSALSVLTVGMVSDVDWKAVISVSAVAGIYSVLTSIAGLPEVKEID